MRLEEVIHDHKLKIKMKLNQINIKKYYITNLMERMNIMLQRN